MVFDEFVVNLVQDGEPLEDALDREGRLIVRDSRADDFVAILPHVRSLDLSEHPYAQIFVGMLANASIPKDLDLASALVDEAAETLSARGDTAGEAMVQWVRGNLRLGIGDLAGASRAWKRSIDIDPHSELIEDLSLANMAYGSFCVNGNVADAMALATAAVASSRERNHGRGEGLGLVYTGHLQIHAGLFEQAQRSFELADDAFAAESDAPYEWPLVFAGLGALAGIRGDAVAADTSFLRGILLSRQMQNPWYEAIVRTLRADHTLHQDHRRAHTDCRFAQKVFDEVGDTWWGATARRVRADAALASGEVEAARLLAEQVLPRLDNPVERGRCLVTAGRAHLQAGDLDSAGRSADEAVGLLTPTGASYVLVEALLLLAECEPWRAPAAIEQARSLTTEDLGFAQLWAARATLSVQVLGCQSIQVGGSDVTFRTSRAEHLILILALAGGRGVDAGLVSEALWADGDPDKLPSNLSTATYDARQALGSEAWRLHRSGSQFWLDLDGALVDYDDAMRRSRGIRPLVESGATDKAEAEHDRCSAIDQLRREILPTLSFEPWVIEANRGRRSFLELLGHPEPVGAEQLG